MYEAYFTLAFGRDSFLELCSNFHFMRVTLQDLN